MVYIAKLPMQRGENELDQWKVLRRVLVWKENLFDEDWLVDYIASLVVRPGEFEPLGC